MEIRHVRVLLVALLITGAAACGERAPEPEAEAEPEQDAGPVIVQLVGDSVLQMQERTLSAGTNSVECSIQFHARVSGSSRQQAVLQGGEIEYFWWESGRPAGGFVWDQREVAQLWGDSILPGGQERLSHPQGFGQSPPGRLVRARVVFNYRTTDSDEVKQTEPYRFYCY